MNFNPKLSADEKAFLEKQFNDYVKSTPMNKKERQALKEWVETGYSVYQNPYNGVYDGNVSIEFLTIYRDLEKIKQQANGNEDERIRLEKEYFGYADDDLNMQYDTELDEPVIQVNRDSYAKDEPLPFE